MLVLIIQIFLNPVVDSIIDSTQVMQARIKVWKSLKVMGIGFDVATGSLAEHTYPLSPSHDFVAIGIGLTPKYGGIGAWLKLSQDVFSGGESNALPSLRLTYTPYYRWKTLGDTTFKHLRFDIFAEGGFHEFYLESGYLRFGASGSWNWNKYVAPLDLELGWGIVSGRWYSAVSGLYARIGTSLYEQEIPVTNPESLVVKSVLTTTAFPNAWLGYRAFTYSLILPSDGFASREFDLLMLGIGLTPPLGIGLWLKVIPYYESDYSVSGDYAALRLTYSPYFSWDKHRYGLYRKLRLDCFLESSFSTLHSEPLLRGGVSGSFSLFPRAVPFDAELGWAYSAYDYGPATVRYSGPYFLISASALGMDVVIGEGRPGHAVSFLNSLKDSRTWVSYEILAGSGGICYRHIPVLSEEELVTTYEVTFLRLGAGFSPPFGLGLSARLWIGTGSWEGPAASLRLSYSPFASYKDAGNITFRRLRVDLFVEPGIGYWRGGEQCFRTGVEGSFSWLPSMPCLHLEAGWISWEQWDYQRRGPYLELSVGLLGGEFIVGKNGKN